MLTDNLLTRTLSNGLTLLVRETSAAPVASFWLWYRVGSRNEQPGLTGLSHWVEHMLLRAPPATPTASIASFSGRADISTG
jgi:zinc protease